MNYLDLAARGKTAWWRYVVTWILAIVLAVVLLLAVMIPLAWWTRSIWFDPSAAPTARGTQSSCAPKRPMTFGNT